MRSDKLTAMGDTIKSRGVEEYLWKIAQTFLVVGSGDPRLNASLNTDLRIARMRVAWKKEESAMGDPVTDHSSALEGKDARQKTEITAPDTEETLTPVSMGHATSP